MGWIAGLPYILEGSVMVIGAFISDYLIANNRMSRMWARKTFVAVGWIIIIHSVYKLQNARFRYLKNNNLTCEISRFYWCCVDELHTGIL